MLIPPKDSNQRRRPVPGTGMFNPFAAQLVLARSESLGRQERLKIFQKMRARFGGREKQIRNSVVKGFRSGGPALSGKAVLHREVPKLPFTVDELAEMGQFSPCRIRKVLPDESCTEALNLNVVMLVMLHSGHAKATFELPGERLSAVAGLCRIVATISDKIGESNADAKKSRLQSIALKVGMAADCVVMHPRFGELVGMLGASWITAKQIRRDRQVYSIVEEAVRESNRIIRDDFPTLADMHGEIETEKILEDLCDVFMFHIEGWYLGREMMGDSIDDPRMLGLF